MKKRGWMRIMEATIAIMIVSGSLLVVYSRQVDRGISPAEYFNSLEGQILADVSTKSDLRLNVLNTENDSLDYSDSNFSALNDFIKTKIPEAFGYSIQICPLNSTTDYCKLDTPTFIATMKKDIFTEEIMVSAELGDGTNAVYNPKKVKLYVWEGQVEVGCAAECIYEEMRCTDDSNYQRCVEDEANCLVWGGVVSCPEAIKLCRNDDCVPDVASLYASYSEPRTEIISGVTYVYYYLTIEEGGGGIYVDLEARQRCWLDGTCEGWEYDVVDKFGTTRVNAGEGISTPDERKIGTNIYPDEMTETWKGTDEFGRPMEISYSIEIPSVGIAN